MYTTIAMCLLVACSTSDNKDSAESSGPSQPATEPSEPAAEPSEPSDEPTSEATVDRPPEPLDLVAGVQNYSLTQMIDDDLVERPVFVHTPPLFDSNSNYPVLFVFHGNGSNEPNDIAEASVPQHAELVNSGAYIGVYPQGHLNSWNLGQELSTADDEAFIQHIVAQLKISAGINPDRIFASGFSNGAGLTQHLAVHTELFQGVVPMATALVTGNEPTSNTPIRSIMQIHGTADDVCPYEGGANNPTGHDFYSSEQSIALWAEHNGCNPSPTTSTTADGNTTMHYEGCTNGVEVVQLKVIGAAHGIPPETEGGLNAFVWDFLNAQ